MVVQFLRLWIQYSPKLISHKKSEWQKYLQISTLWYAARDISVIDFDASWMQFPPMSNRVEIFYIVHRIKLFLFPYKKKLQYYKSINKNVLLFFNFVNANASQEWSYKVWVQYLKSTYIGCSSKKTVWKKWLYNCNGAYLTPSWKSQNMFEQR